MESRTLSLVATTWVLLAVIGGLGLVVTGQQIVSTVGVVLVVIGLVSLMPAMQFYMDALDEEPEPAE